MMMHQHLQFFLLRGVRNIYFKKEAIQLRFRKMICSFLFNWVLCGYHHKGKFERVGGTVHSHLLFFHDFEKSRLRFCGSAVDFIYQNDIAEYRTVSELKIRFFRIENRSSRYIAWHKVRGKLDPRKARGECPGH